MTFANIALTSQTDGILYCSSVYLPASEADLGVPVPMLYNKCISAILELQSFFVTTDTAYVVMQTDWGDGVWVDAAWVVNSTVGVTTFILGASAEPPSTSPASVQQSRVFNVSPGSSGTAAIPLGGRVRFTGKGVFTAGSSSSPSSGLAEGVLATIRYKLTGLR